MNNTTAPAAPQLPTQPLHVVAYESAHTFVLALTIAGSGIMIGLFVIVCVLVVLTRRLTSAVSMLRQESGTAARSGLLNGKEEDDKKKRRAEQDSGTSCADEDED